MNLETEFQFYRERLQLEWLLRESCEIGPDLEPSTWVKLIRPLGLLSSDQALLVCRVSQWQWLAWIPDWGEVVLESSQFILLAEWDDWLEA
jgi:hypothetical protein